MVLAPLGSSVGRRLLSSSTRVDRLSTAFPLWHLRCAGPVLCRRMATVADAVAANIAEKQAGAKKTEEHEEEAGERYLVPAGNVARGFAFFLDAVTCGAVAAYSSEHLIAHYGCGEFKVIQLR